MIDEKWNLMLSYLNDPMNHYHWNKFDKKFRKKKKENSFLVFLMEINNL